MRTNPAAGRNLEAMHFSKISPLYNIQTPDREDVSDTILEKLELAGRVPSKEKFRRMACQTFITTGSCPYNDKCEHCNCMMCHMELCSCICFRRISARFSCQIQRSEVHNDKASQKQQFVEGHFLLARHECKHRRLTRIVCHDVPLIPSFYRKKISSKTWILKG